MSEMGRSDQSTWVKKYMWKPTKEGIIVNQTSKNRHWSESVKSLTNATSPFPFGHLKKEEKTQQSETLKLRSKSYINWLIRLLDQAQKKKEFTSDWNPATWTNAIDFTSQSGSFV